MSTSGSQPQGRCPFCGSTKLKVKPVWTDYRFVACLDCKAAGPVMKTEAEAVEAFDSRCPTPADIEVYRFKILAEMLHDDLKKADPDKALLWAIARPDVFAEAE